MKLKQNRNKREITENFCNVFIPVSFNQLRRRLRRTNVRSDTFLIITSDVCPNIQDHVVRLCAVCNNYGSYIKLTMVGAMTTFALTLYDLRTAKLCVLAT